MVAFLIGFAIGMMLGVIFTAILSMGPDDTGEWREWEYVF